MSSGEGFGPDGPAAGGAPPFAVAGPPQVALDAARSGTASFTVSNVTGRPVRARVFVQPTAGADAAWFTVGGGPERALPVAGTVSVEVAVRIPEQAPAGTYAFALGAALEEAPDRVVSGTTVFLAVRERPRRRFPWWIVVVAVIALVLLAGGGFLVWNLTRPDPTPSPTPTSTRAVHFSGTVTVTANTYVDLDAGTTSSSPDPGVDVYVYQGGGSGELGIVGQGPPRLSVVTEPSFEACRAAPDYDDLNAQNIDLAPDRTTYVCVQATDQRMPSLLVIGPADGAGFPVEITTWQRGQS